MWSHFFSFKIHLQLISSGHLWWQNSPYMVCCCLENQSHQHNQCLCMPTTNKSSPCQSRYVRWRQGCGLLGGGLGKGRVWDRGEDLWHIHISWMLSQICPVFSSDICEQVNYFYLSLAGLLITTHHHSFGGYCGLARNMIGLFIFKTITL